MISFNELYTKFVYNFLAIKKSISQNISYLIKNVIKIQREKICIIKNKLVADVYNHLN